MNRLEALSFFNSFFAGLKGKTPKETDLKPFMDLVASLRRDLPVSIPLLRDLADFGTNDGTNLLDGRIERRYQRLCRVQEELKNLDFKKVAPDVSPEDYVFSRIDFSRYRQIDEKNFELVFSRGLVDFNDDFYKENFGLDRKGIQASIENSYKKQDGVYRLQKESPLVLSVMRTLETSLETMPLFTPGEINAELNNLLGFVEGGSGTNRAGRNLLPETKSLFPLLVLSLDNTSITHADGEEAKLFISEKGDLSGTFRPQGKPWTHILIPAELIKVSQTSQ